MLTHETKNGFEIHEEAPETFEGGPLDIKAADTLSGFLNANRQRPTFNGSCQRELVEQINTCLSTPVGRHNMSIYEAYCGIIPKGETVELPHLYGYHLLAEHDGHGITLARTAAKKLYPTVSFYSKLQISHNSNISPHSALNGANYIVGGSLNTTSLPDVEGFWSELLRETTEVNMAHRVGELNEHAPDEVRMVVKDSLYDTASKFNNEPATFEELNELMYDEFSFCRFSTELDWLLQDGEEVLFRQNPTSHIHLGLETREADISQMHQTYTFDLCRDTSPQHDGETPRYPLLHIGRNYMSPRMSYRFESGGHAYNRQLLLENDYEGVAEYKQVLRATLNALASSLGPSNT